jgi:hypothetical protein
LWNRLSSLFARRDRLESLSYKPQKLDLLMLDFSPVRRKEITIEQLAQGLTPTDLAHYTQAMVETMLGLIAECADADVTFIPRDPEANDPYAEDAGDVNLAWTLGHVIVHTTASAEESAFLAAELARGVAYHGRSRSEVPWESMTTINQCRLRLEESRRMRLASLQLWPAVPDLANSYEPWAGAGSTNALTRFVRGLSHDDSHLEQIANIVQQVQAARQLSIEG